MTFEWFVARRYLQGGRGAARDRFVSAVTVIAVAAVAAGVMALVLALSINGGFRHSFEEKLLGGTAHITLTKKNATGIDDYREMGTRLLKLPGVVNVSPALYETVLISSGSRAKGVVLKGIDPESAPEGQQLFANLREGAFNLTRTEGDPEPLLIGHELARTLGVFVGDTVLVTSPQGRLTPFGLVPRYTNFRVVGIFEAGSWDFDAGWGFTALSVTQSLFRLGDTVSAVELRVEDVYAAGRIANEVAGLAGEEFAATPWMEVHESLFRALRLEKLVTSFFIGMIVFVAGLNILILLVMQSIQKRRDIAVLLAMGVKTKQIQNIFLLHGLAIGALGTVIGLSVGYAVAIIGQRYEAFALDPRVYGISYVPFEADIVDGLMIAAVALLVSFAATIYPSRRAVRVTPVEVLRYE